MPAQLLALNGGDNILLDKPVLLLGRHPECDIQINSKKISRRHCCIAQVETYLVVRDLGSTNGIRINGVRVVEGKLNPSDELTVGNTRYRVSWDSAIIDKNDRHEPALEASDGPRTENDDQMLEECDEPVALNDPEHSQHPYTPKEDPSGRHDHNGPKTALEMDSEPDSDELSEDDPRSMILPDNLELAPPSDIKGPSSSKNN